MEDMIYLSLVDAPITKVNNHFMIHRFVVQIRPRYEAQTIGYIYSCTGLTTPDPSVMNGLKARFLAFPGCKYPFIWIPLRDDISEETIVRRIFACLKQELSYQLFPEKREFRFPVKKEIDRNVKDELGYGHALMKSLRKIPRDTCTFNKIGFPLM